MKGVFFSFPSSVKGYKIWLIEENKCIISHDVTFNEKCSYRTLVQGVDTNQKHEVNQNEVSQVSELELSSNDANSSDQGGGIQFNPDMESETDHQNYGTRTSHEIEIEAELGEDLSQDNPLSDYTFSRDRARRQIRPPSRFTQVDFIAFALNIADSLELKEPVTYVEAKANKIGLVGGRKAMDEEIQSLKKNETWILVPRTKGKRVIGCKWVYKLKPKIPGVEKARFKARLDAKGYSQEFQIQIFLEHSALHHVLLDVFSITFKI